SGASGVCQSCRDGARIAAPALGESIGAHGDPAPIQADSVAGMVSLLPADERFPPLVAESAIGDSSQTHRVILLPDRELSFLLVPAWCTETRQRDARTLHSRAFLR